MPHADHESYVIPGINKNNELDPRDVAAAAELAANAPPLTAEARNLLLALYTNPPAGSSPTTAA